MDMANIQLRRLGTDDVVTQFDCGDDASYRDDNKAGCRFITVDAYAGALDFYYKQGFVPLSKADEGSDTRLLYFDLESLPANDASKVP